MEDTAAEAQDDEDDYLRDALKSSWYKDYIRNGNPPHGAKLLKTFKKRFNMTFVTFQDLVKKAKDNEWFPDYEKDYTFGQKNVSLDILILTSVRFMGRGGEVDELADLAGVSEKSIRKFYKAFSEACDKHSYPI